MDLLVGDTYSTKEIIKELTPKEQNAKKKKDEIALENSEDNRAFRRKYAEYNSKIAETLMEKNYDLIKTEALGLAWNNMPEEMLNAYKAFTNEQNKLLGIFG